MRIVFELEQDHFDAVAAGDADVLVGAVGTVEVKQADGGLLTLERPARLVESVSRVNAGELGIAAGGPSIRVALAREQGEQDG